MHVSVGGCARAVSITLATILLGACASMSGTHLGVDPGRLAPWTRALRDQQPEHPYVIVYNNRRTRLVFVAAQHENSVDSETFRLIDRSFTLWPVQSVIVEGSSAALGPQPAELIAITRRPPPSSGMDPDGETGPAVRNAIKLGARIYGGEADDLAIRASARKAGIADLDLLGYYVLRVIPQWLRDGSVTGPTDPALSQLVSTQISRSASELGITPNIMPTFADFALWYQRTNGKRLSEGIDQEEAGPLADGPWPTNRIGAAVSRRSDTHLVWQIADRLKKDRSVLVVFGGSHAMIDKPALDAMLGQPCYVGRDIDAARRECTARSDR
jgi:hypothetical protein